MQGKREAGGRKLMREKEGSPEITYAGRASSGSKALDKAVFPELCRRVLWLTDITIGVGQRIFEPRATHLQRGV